MKGSLISNQHHTCQTDVDIWFPHDVHCSEEILIVSSMENSVDMNSILLNKCNRQCCLTPELTRCSYTKEHEI